MQSILIANRGEIAVRVIRTCKEMGIKTVAIYSEADVNSMHVKLADKSICIGPPETSRSYLDIPKVMSALEVSNAEGVHPGYGFLSENPKFAEIVRASGKVFIGPAPETLELIGDKVKAKEVARKIGLPLVPGSDGPVDFQKALEVASRVGYPVVIKAAAGGGGRGIRVVNNDRELREKFPLAVQEAEVAFGDGRLYVEKYLINPKHIEFQVLADRYGNVLTLGERECSIQRRHQKLIEESPSSVLGEEKRMEIEGLVADFCREIGYEGAGTVEFLMDQEGNFYFMEMNGRIQVEHPVTEMVYHIDLVEWQIRIARGERLELKKPQRRGYAIECRINAEDPNTFLPSPGKVEELYLPGGYGVRVDTHLYCGYTVPPFYDSLIAKLVCWGLTREEAIARALRALEEFRVSGKGLKTNIDFHKRVLSSREFRQGKHHIRFVEELML
ncbi:MAG: acetyl-CoA carboxylase biotin carboxylase subunit [Aquificaceae bacterium]|nr:acetyl-CoA carboxylase biotin carboxylase subunit [Aquificaceae bacterium]MCX7989186.1 acetyl-CoA carboxylase biotin carboxylase subunit [Aquificaceae bacterium]MDW8032477.1 acetyl-CoA carboxylase biotin carboxylase subunit [Aquificaceae bacterium]MDW8294251.1 acetyl-CoA carboxylase biotin carboxylase subunit [Aquificaceae bacterium]